MKGEDPFSRVPKWLEEVLVGEEKEKVEVKEIENLIREEEVVRIVGKETHQAALEYISALPLSSRVLYLSSTPSFLNQALTSLQIGLKSTYIFHPNGLNPSFDPLA